MIRQWWSVVLALLLTFVLVRRLPASTALAEEPWSLLFFVLAMLTCFASRRCFHRFKRTVIDMAGEPARLRQVQGWHGYLLVRRHALWLAALPAVCAILASPLGLPLTPAFLLLLCSLLLLWLYRTPRQLCYIAAAH